MTACTAEVVGIYPDVVGILAAEGFTRPCIDAALDRHIVRTDLCDHGRALWDDGPYGDALYCAADVDAIRALIRDAIEHAADLAYDERTQ